MENAHTDQARTDTKRPLTGRFAPTPSGRMHLGNLFAAMLAWASVRSRGGRMILRIEDLDTERCSMQWADLIKQDLAWLGLDWDEEAPPQRERGEAYAAALERLQEQGLIYPCWCTRGLLHAASAPHAEDGHSVYPGFCRVLTAEERAARAGKPASTRLIVPDEVISFIDGVQGPYSENLARDCGDFVVRKADGGWAYQLAVVVDDIASGVSEVARGRDLLSSAPRQIYLYRLLGSEPPAYFHAPLLLGPGGRRLSKRDLSLDMGTLRENFSPEQIVGHLAHLAGLTETPVPLPARELPALFDWSRVPRQDIEVDPAAW